jgi:hypothetical protein
MDLVRRFMSEFGHLLADQAAMLGAQVVVADRPGFARQTCSAGTSMPILDFQTVNGGVKRAASATIGIAIRHRLKNVAAPGCGETAAFAAMTACGEQGAHVGPVAAVTLASAKQDSEHEALASV